MAEKREYKPGIRRIKDFFTKGKINPKSPRARLERQKAQKQRAKGIGTSGDTDTEFKGSVKNLTKKGMARKMEDAKPTATAGKAAGKAAAAGVGTAAGKQTGKRAMAGLSEFGKAFAAARKAGKKDFTFRDKQYAAITKQEVQKAGASGLGDYLNKLKRKDTKIAKAPGQKKKGGMAKFNVGGSVDEKELQKISDRASDVQKTKRVLERRKREAQMRQLRESPAGTPVRMEQERPGRKMSKDERRQKYGFPRRPRPTAMGAASLGRRARPEEQEYLKNMRGAAMTDAELRRVQREGMKKGGSVMARGCKMGRKKPTKLY